MAEPLPPLPPGFQLVQPGGLPPLPPGFVLQPSEPAPEGSFGERVVTQLTKGVTGLMGTPRALADAGTAGVQYLGDQLGVKVPQFPEGASPLNAAIPGGMAPRADQMNRVAFDAGIPNVNATTPAGKVLDVGIQAIPGGLALGGASGLLPAFSGGIGSETAGQIADAAGAGKWASLGARVGGGVLGGGAGVALQEAGRAGWQGVRNAFGAGDPQIAANKIAAKALQRDALDPQKAADDMANMGPGATIADVGGKNVRGTARAAAGRPGRAAEYTDDVLATRRADEPARVGEAINQVSSNKGFTSTVDDIIAMRAKKAAPLYEKAGIPADPAQYAKAPVLTAPEVGQLISKSKDIQAAVEQARRLPQYADLPDNSIVLLDKAYKNIGGKAEAAKRAGDGVAYRDLNELRNQLRDVIVKEQPAYGDALKTFASESRLKDAIEQGRKLFSGQADAEAIGKAYNALAPDGQLLFRQGVAEQLRDVAGRSTIGSPAARVFGGPKMQEKLKAVLGKDFDGFASRMNKEATFNRTARDITSGSRTAPMLAEMDDLAAQTGAMKDMMRGDWINLLTRGAGSIKDRVVQGRNDRVNEAIAKIFLETDQGKSIPLLRSLTDQQAAQELAKFFAQQKLIGSALVGPAMGAQQQR